MALVVTRDCLKPYGLHFVSVLASGQLLWSQEPSSSLFLPSANSLMPCCLCSGQYLPISLNYTEALVNR